MRTDDPIYDMEKSQEDTRIPIAECDFCHEPIFGGDDSHYADTFFYDGVEYACEECKEKFLEKYKHGGI